MQFRFHLCRRSPAHLLLPQPKKSTSFTGFKRQFFNLNAVLSHHYRRFSYTYHRISYENIYVNEKSCHCFFILPFSFSFLSPPKPFLLFSFFLISPFLSRFSRRFLLFATLFRPGIRFVGALYFIDVRFY